MQGGPKVFFLGYADGNIRNSRFLENNILVVRFVAWRNRLRARIESVTDYYCNAESLYTEEVTKDRTGN